MGVAGLGPENEFWPVQVRQSSGRAWNPEMKALSQTLRLLTCRAEGKAHLFTGISSQGDAIMVDELRLWVQGVASDWILIFLPLHFVHTEDWKFCIIYK